MFIYVDESGTFAHSTKSDSWCIVAGYVVPEIARKAVEETLSLLKRQLGRGFQDEVKLKDLSEAGAGDERWRGGGAGRGGRGVESTAASLYPAVGACHFVGLHHFLRQLYKT